MRLGILGMLTNLLATGSPSNTIEGPLSGKGHHGRAFRKQLKRRYLRRVAATAARKHNWGQHHRTTCHHRLGGR